MDRIQLLIYLTFLSYVTSDTCTSVGMVRVQNLNLTGTDKTYLQVCLNHTNGNKYWSFICSQDMNGIIWSVDNHHVWCRSRSLLYEGFSSVQITSGMYGQGELKIANVDCNRTINEGIIDCYYNTTLDECHYLNGLECSPCFNTTDGNNCNPPGICTVNEACRCTSSCENGGFCDQGRCQCRYPYEGESCQYRACVESCLNNATCDNSTGTCKCIQQYYGPNCELVQCLSGCNSNQECCNLTGMCECKSSYFGPNCEFQNCSMSCPVNQTCDTSNGICRMDSTDCIDCSNCTDNCTDNNMLNDIPRHYIWISAGVTFVLTLCILIAGLICCVVMLIKWFAARKRSQSQKNVLYAENGSSTENVATTNSIEMDQTGLKSKRKLKKNAPYSSIDNTRDVRPSTPDPVGSNEKYYSMLSSPHHYSEPDQEIKRIEWVNNDDVYTKTNQMIHST